MSHTTIKVAEHFYSLQCEGRTVGVPSVFLRLSGCVLNCQWCDTVEVWKQGKLYTFQELYDIFDGEGYLSKLMKGAHLILTGGDPLIQQMALIEFLNPLVFGDQPYYIEVETEGVLYPSDDLSKKVGHYNVSPKLRNSGMEEKRRLKWDVLSYHAFREQDIFKFPVSNEEDVMEVLEIIQRIGPMVHRSRIYLMPICDSRKTHDEVGPVVAELAKKYCVRYSPRLHLQLWDKTTGV